MGEVAYCDGPVAQIAGGTAESVGRTAGGGRVSMRRHLYLRQDVQFLSTGLSVVVCGGTGLRAHLDGGAPAKIGEQKGSSPIAAKGNSQKRKQRLVLADLHRLSVARSPALGHTTPNATIRISPIYGVPIVLSPR